MDASELLLKGRTSAASKTFNQQRVPPRGSVVPPRVPMAPVLPQRLAAPAPWPYNDPMNSHAVSQEALDCIALLRNQALADSFAAAQGTPGFAAATGHSTAKLASPPLHHAPFMSAAAPEFFPPGACVTSVPGAAAPAPPPGFQPRDIVSGEKTQPKPSVRAQKEQSNLTSTPVKVAISEQRMQLEDSIRAMLTGCGETCPEVEQGDGELPSVGSAGHFAGECRRCNFFPNGHCANGRDCGFCHFPHEKRKLSRRERRERRQERQEEELAAEAASTTSTPLITPTSAGQVTPVSLTQRTKKIMCSMETQTEGLPPCALCGATEEEEAKVHVVGKTEMLLSKISTEPLAPEMETVSARRVAELGG